MRKRAATYEIVYVLANAATRTITRTGAPRPETLYTACRGFTNYTGNPARQNAVFAIRYFPSRKAWGVYDLRQFTEMTLANGMWVVRCGKVLHETPDKDAAIMVAILRLGI